MTSEPKKLGGVYALEDEDLKLEMIKLNAVGKQCDTLTAFMDEVFGQDKKERNPKDRFLVCFMPASYPFDLENDCGAASPMDAAQAYIDLVLEGYSVFVWDRVNRTLHYTEQNEYIYKSIIDEELSEQDPEVILERMPDQELLQLEQLIKRKFRPNILATHPEGASYLDTLRGLKGLRKASISALLKHIHKQASKFTDILPRADDPNVEIHIVDCRDELWSIIENEKPIRVLWGKDKTNSEESDFYGDIDVNYRFSEGGLTYIFTASVPCWHVFDDENLEGIE